MEIRVDGTAVHHAEHGSGVPLVALHGAGVDHREIEAAIEPLVPRDGYRRIYPDLPGMGRTAAGALEGNDEVVTLLGDFVDHLVGSEPVLLLGHSYGAYLARGIAARRRGGVFGLALLCPVGERTGEVPEHGVVRSDPDVYEELDPAQRAEYDEYFVVRTRATARRYRESVHPGTELVDEAGLGRIFANWPVAVGSGPDDVPALIVAGRRDSTAGYHDSVELLRLYPRAALAVVEDAGHALMHERPALLASLLADWLDRARAAGP